MAEDSIDLIKQGVAALNRRDLQGMLATLHPDVRLEPLRAVHDGTFYEGHQGLQDWLGDMQEDWEDQHVEMRDAWALSSGQVVLEAVLHVRFRSTGVEVAAPGAWLCEFREDLISRIRFFEDAESAVAAAGSTGPS
jgi:ketosteroid isomerase-like protein